LDLGSSRTRAWTSGRGMILDVPTVALSGDGPVHPVRRGAIVDTPGTAHMLDRLLGHRLPRVGRPFFILITPVLGGVAFRTELGLSDLDASEQPARIVDAVVTMVTTMLRQDRTTLTLDALRRGVLLAGGGALRPDITYRLTQHLHAPVTLAPAPHTAAVRGASHLLSAAHTHPSAAATGPPPASGSG
ncbi:rod shape-determining protein, partial [Streptomyces sp. NPDC127574]|uniref:rod shape-determining protein n=1 Tax=Streptomyces sp. NPDC127574 TaxID=3345401 RepID=UPI00362EB7FC